MQLLTSLFTLSFILLSIGLIAQSSNNNTPTCYQGLRSDGINLLSQGKYNKAVVSFFSAYRCADRPADHDIDRLMDEVINKLKKVAENAQQDAKEAEEARSGEAKAKIEAQQAQAQAEINAEKAEKSAREAESLRLALIADIEREKKNYRLALPLAYLALQLSAPENRTEAFNNFAKVVRDSFVQHTPIETKLYQFNVHQGFFFIRDDKSVSIYQDNNGDKLERFSGISRYLLAPDTSDVLLIASNGGSNSIYSAGLKARTILSDQHTERVTYFTSDTKNYLTSSRDNTTIIWDKEGKLGSRLTGHQGNIYQHLLLPDQQIILTRSSDGRLKRWSLDGKYLADQAESTYFQTISSPSKGSNVLASTAEGELLIWDHEKLDQDPQRIKGSNSPIDQVDFFRPDLKTWTTKDILGNVRLWTLGGEPIAIPSEITTAQGFIILPNRNEILVWIETGECFRLDDKGHLLSRWPHTFASLKDIVYAPVTETFLLTAHRDGMTTAEWTNLEGVPILRW